MKPQVKRGRKEGVNFGGWDKEQKGRKSEKQRDKKGSRRGQEQGTRRGLMMK